MTGLVMKCTEDELTEFQVTNHNFVLDIRSVILAI